MMARYVQSLGITSILCIIENNICRVLAESESTEWVGKDGARSLTFQLASIEAGIYEY